MRPKKHETAREGDLFRAWLDGEIAPLYSDKGRPGIESRFVIGLLLLKQIYGLSDEVVCERWVHDPYFQHFSGYEFFQHEFPHERSDLSHLCLPETTSDSIRGEDRRGSVARQLGRTDGPTSGSANPWRPPSVSVSRCSKQNKP